MNRMRKRLHEILENVSPHDRAIHIFDVFMITLITLNVLVVTIETIPGLHETYLLAFTIFDIFSVIVFTIEYILRLWVITVSPAYQRPVLGRLRYAITPLALVDLIAIAPFYIPLLLPMHLIDLRFLRILRLVRIFRIFKLSRYSEAVKTLERVLYNKKEELAATFFILILLLIFSSSLIYYAEHDAQPEKFSSIPDAMWWGVITLATVGYGDVYPVTVAGKIIGGFVAIIGIGLFALPAGIFASGFAEELAQRKMQCATICPHCGKPLSPTYHFHPGETVQDTRKQE
ncbi:MAG: ion transporter [Methanomicrobiales archaeon]|nr:ion transporter [Methanomicrobiales archaeon]